MNLAGICAFVLAKPTSASILSFEWVPPGSACISRREDAPLSPRGPRGPGVQLNTRLSARKAKIMSKKITLLAGITLTGLSGLSVVACSDDGGTEAGVQPAAPLTRPLTPGTGQGANGAQASQNGQVANNGATNNAANNVDNTNTGAMGQTSGAMGQTSGAMAPASTTMAPVGGNIPIGAGFAITPEAGYVAGMTNGLGIQGSFYTFSDSSDGAVGTSAIAPETFAAEVGSSSICVSGTAAAIPPDPADPGNFLYGDVWGAAVGFNLANPGDAIGGPGPWARGGITGFSYTLSGADIPTGMRFTVKYDGEPENADQYCSGVVGGAGPQTNLFANVSQACWEAGGVALPASDLVALQWGIVAETAGPVTFDFCIDDLTAIQ